MTFVSLSFFIFILVTSLIYFLTPSRFQWVVLLLASYIFFWLNSSWLVVFLLAATVVTFFDGKAVYHVNRNAERYLKENEGLSRTQKKECCPSETSNSPRKNKMPLKSPSKTR